MSAQIHTLLDYQFKLRHVDENMTDMYLKINLKEKKNETKFI